MTLQQIRHIIAIEECGSFSEAAKRLFISQPSISAMVKDLEQELGIQIFRRGRQGLTLTAEGRVFLKYAYQIQDCEQELKRHFSDGSYADFQQFSVSSQHYSFVIDAFISFQQTVVADRYDLQLKEGATADIIQDVARQRSEIGILYLSSVTKKHMSRVLEANYLRFTPLAELPAKAFLSVDHPLAKQDSITVEELQDYPCVIFDQGEDAQIYYAEDSAVSLFEANKRLCVTDLLASSALVKRCGAYNIGSGIMGDRDSSEEGICAVPVEGVASMLVGWIGLKNAELSANAKRFLDILSQKIANG